MRKKQRTIKHLIDEHGKKIVHVPLSDTVKSRYAILYENEYLALMDAGLSSRWRLKRDRGAVRVMSWLREIRGEVSVSRLVLGAGQGQEVTYANANPLDLRSSN